MLRNIHDPNDTVTKNTDSVQEETKRCTMCGCRAKEGSGTGDTQQPTQGMREAAALSSLFSFGLFFSFYFFFQELFERVICQILHVGVGCMSESLEKAGEHGPEGGLHEAT